jgi:mono/diheme cytochrome c family protein
MLILTTTSMEGMKGGPLKRATLLISGMVGATVILAVACSGSALPSPTLAPTPTALPREDALAVRGESLTRSALPTACVACHSADGTPRVGPTWGGIYGGEETLSDGTTVTVDDEYIRESIVDPNAKVVEGFSPNIMPRNYRDTLSDEDIEAITAYIRSLQ